MFVLENESTFRLINKSKILKTTQISPVIKGFLLDCSAGTKLETTEADLVLVRNDAKRALKEFYNIDYQDVEVCHGPVVGNLTLTFKKAAYIEVLVYVDVYTYDTPDVSVVLEDIVLHGDGDKKPVMCDKVVSNEYPYAFIKDENEAKALFAKKLPEGHELTKHLVRSKTSFPFCVNPDGFRTFFPIFFDDQVLLWQRDEEGVNHYRIINKFDSEKVILPKLQSENAPASLLSLSELTAKLLEVINISEVIVNSEHGKILDFAYVDDGVVVPVDSTIVGDYLPIKLSKYFDVIYRQNRACFKLRDADGWGKVTKFLISQISFSRFMLS